MGMAVFIARVIDRLLVYFRCIVLSICLSCKCYKPSKNVTLSDSEGSLPRKYETLRSQRTLPHIVPMFFGRATQVFLRESSGLKGE